MSRFASLLFLLLFFIFPPVFPQNTDAISIGVTYFKIQKPGPFSIDVVAVDIGIPDLHFLAFRASGLVPSSRQAQEVMSKERTVLAAVNGDFFSFETSWPVGNHVQDGVMIHGVVSRRSHIAFDYNNSPIIERLSFEGSVTRADRTVRLRGVNLQGPVRSNVLYTPDNGGGLRGEGKVKLVVRSLGGVWKACDTVVAVVARYDTSAFITIDSGRGVMVLDADDAVLGACLPGDTLNFFLCFAGDHRPLKQVLGGAGRILRKGRFSADENVRSEGLNLRFMTDRHPRTFVGFNRDTTRILLCTVDGRQESSVGMTFQEMADFMLTLGISEAVNLDGGGSTTMVVQGRVVNTPSDPTGERGVANTLHIVKEIP